ncbi:MAG: right-handed parallel beta-helix repeat-containing protein [Patescibacteria group bacterium]|nr:right-handed parallel beta-helix repeat-containing protein [Patescibacteria group bacterium]
MWYTDIDDDEAYKTGYTVSNDGVNWSEGTIVSGLADKPAHALVEYINGGYKMWYWDSGSGAPGNIYGIDAIRYAESIDGIYWENDQPITQVDNTVIASSGWNSGSYGPGDLIHNSSGSEALDDSDIWNNKFVMYYMGTNGDNEYIGLAYSADGKEWKGYNGGTAPVLSPSTDEWDFTSVGYPTVVKENETWMMWFGGGPNTNHGIGYATSADGITWTKSATNPIMHKDDGVSWRNDRTYTPIVIKDGDVYKMWFTGKDSSGNYAIGYATNTNPNAYSTIQAAIDAASEGDTINVAAGTYTPDNLDWDGYGFLRINKPLTLKGAGSSNTIVDGEHLHSVISGYDGKHSTCLWIGNSDVTLEGLTIKGCDWGIRASDAHSGANEISSLLFNDVTVTDNFGHGFVFENYNDVSFSGVDFIDSNANENGDRGIYISPSSNAEDFTLINTNANGNKKAGFNCQGTLDGLMITGGTFNDNTGGLNYEGKGPYFGAGIELSGVSNATIDDIEINENGLLGPPDIKEGPPGDEEISGGAGIIIKGNSDNIEIKNSALEGNANGILIEYWEKWSTPEPTNIVANYNKIQGSVYYDVLNWGPNQTVNAEKNWWGTNVKSEIEALISGDVDYRFWYMDEDMIEINYPPVHNATQDTYYLAIQDAIDAANDGDTIVVAAGTYAVDSSINVNKSVTITTDASATIVGQNSDTVPVLRITANNITIENLEITLTPDAISAYSKQYNGLIHVGENKVIENLTGIKILNNKIFTPSQGDRNTMSEWGAFGIKFERGCMATITGNTIYNTRQGISGSYGSSLDVKNNTIYNTKGGICIYTNFGDIENHNIVDNLWDAPISDLSHSEWDIVWHSGGSFVDVENWEEHYQTYVLNLSGDNSNAYVVDWRQASTGKATQNNRSHVFVYDGDVNGEGGVTTPMNNIMGAITGVTPGGKVFISAGTYGIAEMGGPAYEPVSINKPLTLQGAGSADTILDAGNPDPHCDVIWIRSSDVTVKGLTVTNGDFGVRINGGTEALDNITFIDVKALDNNGSGFVFEGPEVSNVTFTNCRAEDNGNRGIYFVPGKSSENITLINTSADNNQVMGFNNQGTMTNLKIEGGTFNNNAGGSPRNTTEGPYYGFGVSVENTTGVNIQGITAKSNGTEGPAEGGAGIVIKGDSSDVNINSVVLTGNKIGLWLEPKWGENPAPQDTTIKNSKILDNVDYGVKNDIEEITVEATKNWWGDPSGPERETPGNSGIWVGQGDRVSSFVDVIPWYANVAKTALSDATYNDAIYTSDTSGQADLPEDVTEITLDDDTVLDVSGGMDTAIGNNIVVGGTTLALNAFTSGNITAPVDLSASQDIGGQQVKVEKAVKLKSGTAGQPITISNVGLANTKVDIPDETTILAPSGWDGKIEPPKTGTKTGTAPSGFSVGNTVVEVGSEAGVLLFDKPVKITLPGVTGEVAYRPSGSNTWQKITVTCDNATNPTNISFPGECYIKVGSDTIIHTYHFTSFASLAATPPSAPTTGGGGMPIWFLQQQQPATPATPATPAAPTTPATPAIPATPATPAVPAPQVLGEKIYADGTLVRGRDKKIFIIVDGQKKYIPNLKELAKYAGQKIYDVANSVLIQYPEVLGEKVIADGALIRGADAKIYAIKNGKKEHVRSLEELRKNYFGKKIYDVSDETLAKY